MLLLLMSLLLPRVLFRFGVHVYVNPPVPPAGVTTAKPLFPPKHVTLPVELILAVTCVI